MKAIATLVAIVAVLGALWWIYSGIDERGYQRGKSETETTYAKRDNKQLVDAQQKILDLQADIRTRESKGDADQAAISATYQEQLSHAHAETDRLVDAVRRGDVRLRDPGANVAACAGGGDGGRTTVAGAAGGRDGPAGGELSREAAEFLLSEAGRADAIVRQLAAAQAVILNDRKICNGA